MSVAAGSRRARVEIQARQDGQSAGGQPIESWVKVCRPWANISGQTGMGTITTPQDGVGASVNAYSMRIPYRTDLTTRMRVVYGAFVFDIKQLRYDLTGRQYVDIVCEAGGNDG